MSILAPTGVLPIAAKIVSTDTTTAITIYDNTSGTATKRIEALNCVSDDTVDAVVELWLYTGSVSYPMGCVAVPASSGKTTAKPRIKLLDTFGVIESDWVPVIHCPPACKIMGSVQTGLSSGKTIWFTGRARKYE